jgi:hypothetical protein
MRRPLNIQLIKEHELHMNDEEKRNLALEVLYKCGQHRYGKGASPFDPAYKVDFAIDPQRLNLLGDLAHGFGGPEFTYRYLPVHFVEQIIEVSLKTARKPIAINGQTIQLTHDQAQGMAKTFATAATVFLLNNLRDKLDEAVRELFIEASAVVEAIHKTLPKREHKRLLSDTIDKIIRETNAARKSRLKAALWEADRGRRLEQLPTHYQYLKNVWRRANEIYKKNRDFTQWTETVTREIHSDYNLDLPRDLVFLLSKHDRSAELRGRLRLGFEQNPSGLALEHSARLCGSTPFEFSTGYLREIARTKSKLSGEQRT